MPTVKVYRYIAEEWESRKLQRVPTILEQAQRCDDWGDMPEIAATMGLTERDVIKAFATYELHRREFMPPMPDYFDKRQFYGDAGSNTVTLSGDNGLTTEEWLKHIVRSIAKLAGPKQPKAKAKRLPRSKEALRKARARAEGRIKPYQRKGPPTTEARIAAKEKEIATRIAKLAEMEANAMAYRP
ncbi:MAG: hypothetical protein ACREMY_26290, partial [bacterium]